MQIIDQFSPRTILGSSTSALPGGSNVSTGQSEDPISIEAFNFKFPPKAVADFLFETYLEAVHWFMMVFHEPTFRSQYDSILLAGQGYHFQTHKSDSKLLLVLLVLSLGAHYTTLERVQAHCPTFDLEDFRIRSLAKVEERLLSLLDGSDIESVQVCVLLGSFYLYHGRPNLAYVVVGAGIRCSQIMGLFKEFSWRGVSDIAKEERRRTFWALFVFDRSVAVPWSPFFAIIDRPKRFASMVYGKPCSLQREEIDVNMPQNLGDTTVQHPNFHSVTSIPDGTTEPVTSFTYVQLKIQLYQIASPIVTDMHFSRNADLTGLAARVMQIDKQLRSWFQSLPPELKLEELYRLGIKDTPQRARVFMLQALALQLAYDNVMILLHRPSLSQNIQSSTVASNEGPLSSESMARQLELSDRTYKTKSVLLTSREHCWESAIQSSNLGLYGQCLDYARETHAAAFLGINLFTASMVLCVFALSNPLSTQAQLAKQAVTRIMSLSRFLADRSILSDQTSLVLRDLINLILEKERKVMLFDRESTSIRPGHDHLTNPSQSMVNTHSRPSMTSQVYQNTPNSQAPFGECNVHVPFPDSLLLEPPHQTHGVPDFASLDFDDGIATLQEGLSLPMPP